MILHIQQLRNGNKMNNIKLFIILACFMFINIIQSLTISSLLSWSNIPEPAKSNLEWVGLFVMVFYIPLFIILGIEIKNKN